MTEPDPDWFTRLADRLDRRDTEQAERDAQRAAHDACAAAWQEHTRLARHPLEIVPWGLFEQHWHDQQAFDQLADAASDVSFNPFLEAQVDWRELFANVPKQDWLIEPFVARGRGHALFAQAKIGKSFLVLGVCALAAAGKQVLSHPPGRPVEVLYCDYEMTEDDLRERLEGFGLGPDNLEHLHYSLLPFANHLDTETGAEELLEAATKVQADLVVIDTTSRAVGGPENDADTFRAFYSHTGKALKRAGIAYLRIDHAGKNLEAGQRGSSAKNDDVDVIWRLVRRDGHVNVIEAERQRMAWVPKEIVVRLVEDEEEGVWAITAPELDEPVWPEGTGQVVAHLEQLEVPVDTTVRAAQRALREAGHGARTTLVGAATKFRKWRETRSYPTFLIDEVNNTATGHGNAGSNRWETPETGGPGITGTTTTHVVGGGSQTPDSPLPNPLWDD